jgi:hypothetical protein
VTDLLLEVLGRDMSCDALVLPAGSSALLGQIPLEALDLIVDPKSRELKVNPASPDMPQLDMVGFQMVPDSSKAALATPPA